MRTAIVTHEGISVWALGATAAVVLLVLIAGWSTGVIGSPSAWLEFVLRIVLTSEAAPAV